MKKWKFTTYFWQLLDDGRKRRNPKPLKKGYLCFHCVCVQATISHTHTCTHTHTHTYILSLSLSRTHAHIHETLSLSLTHTHTHYRKHTHYVDRRAIYVTRSQRENWFLESSRCHGQPDIDLHPLTQSLALSLTHSLFPSLSCSLTHSLFPSLSLALSLTLSRTSYRWYHNTALTSILNI